MPKKTYAVAAVILTLAGVLFSGYLSGTKLLTGTCAFNEPCPYFLGYPACWYGFAMFLVMFIASLLAWLYIKNFSAARKINAIVSFLGILFAGRFVWLEIARWMQVGNPNYALKFPTCVYGLIFYVIIFAISVWPVKTAEGDRPFIKIPA